MSLTDPIKGRGPFIDVLSFAPGQWRRQGWLVSFIAFFFLLQTLADVLLPLYARQLPRGYDTLVGERGVKLSGGKRQRIAIARAFLADAPILILDEATSSLDSRSEALIQDSMQRLMLGRTAIVIAHRLSTVQKLDRTLVFERGRIVEEGTHASLIRIEGGVYRQLFERQALVRAETQEMA